MNAQQRIELLETERNTAQDEAQENWQSVKKWKQRAAAAEARLAALRPYLQHKRECNSKWIKADGSHCVCTCGLATFLGEGPQQDKG